VQAVHQLVLALPSAEALRDHLFGGLAASGGS